MERPFLCLSLLATSLIALGCGSGEPPRYGVSGKVTVKGEPVDEGVVQFVPLDGQASNSTALLKNGDYAVPKDKGLFAGKYKVILVAYEAANMGGEAPGVSTPKSGSKGGAVIPPEYGANSKQIVEVKAGQTNTFNFIIK